MKNILALAPHSDDIELGCGGTIAKLSDEGHHVDAIVFSLAEKSLPDGFTRSDIEMETREALSVLGVRNVTILGAPVREFQEYRQEILDVLIKQKGYDMVFCTSVNDIHQDHCVVAKEAIRAFKRSTLLGYPLLWNTLQHRREAYSQLTTEHIKKKCLAISMYKSQAHRPYMTKRYLESVACANGVDAGSEYAEVFEVYRWIF